MTESKIQAKVVAHAKKMGCSVFSFKERAMPDRGFIFNGKLLLIEFKAPGGKPRDNQQFKFFELFSNGVRVFIVDSIDAGIKLLEDTYHVR